MGNGEILYTMDMILPPDRLRTLLDKAVSRAYPDIVFNDITVDPVKDAAFGDYASNMAMRLAPLVKQPPKEVAQHVLAQLGTVPMLEKASVAGPGFMNFTLKPSWLMQQVNAVMLDKTFGASKTGNGQKIVVEFISANPTGPMTLGNGRGAFAGDTISNVLALSGWKVWREYYLNDVGNQVNILAESVIRRYFQAHGIPTEYPDYCYQGDYVIDLASKVKIDKLKLQDMMTVRDRIKGRILNTMIADLQRTVEKKLKVKFNAWTRESSLYVRKLDEKVMARLRSHDLVYEKDEATWFRTTAFGDDKDRVLIKKDGEKTYFLSDIALRFNRFVQRAIDHELLYLGADHHGYIGRLQAAMAALGFAKKLDVQIVQLVRLLKDGQEVKMSKRAGTYVTLEEVVDEVGLDVARFFFLSHSANSHMDFDLNLAKEKSDKNPVFYVQYAHARMASILKKVGRTKPVNSKEPAHTSELALIKAILHFPNVVAEVAETKETQKLPFYAVDLATKFHDFYTNCRVIDGDKVWQQRLQLVKATKTTLAKTLGLMGVSAPEKM